MSAERDAAIEAKRAEISLLNDALKNASAELEALKRMPDDPGALDRLSRHAYERFGDWPPFEQFGETSFRVWYRTWHYKDGATSSNGLSSQGFSRLDALRRLLALADGYEHVARGDLWTCKYCKERDCDY